MNENLRKILDIISDAIVELRSRVEAIEKQLALYDIMKRLEKLEEKANEPSNRKQKK